MLPATNRAAAAGGRWAADNKGMRGPENPGRALFKYFRRFGSALADHVYLNAVGFFRRQKLMALLCAEMWHVDDGGRIVGEKAHHSSGRQGAHPLGRLKDGEWAKKPRSIEFFINIHARAVRRVLQFVHRDVSTPARDAGRLIAYVESRR